MTAESGAAARRAQYRRLQDVAYDRLRRPRIFHGRPATTLAEQFPYIAATEAQSGQTPAHAFGLMSLRLVGTGEATWRDLATVTLPGEVALRMARTAEQFHSHRGIIVPTIEGRETSDRLAFLAENNAFVFERFMEHAFHNIAALSPEGERVLGARLDYNQGIAHPANAPRPTAETLPIVESYLADRQTFLNVYKLLLASTHAILGPGREFKDAFLDRLEAIAREHADDPADEERRREKRVKDLQARIDLWRATIPLIREAVDEVPGFTPEQKDNYAWNSSMTFVTPDTHLIPSPR